MVTAGRRYDLYSDAFRADTYATFARMREDDPLLCQPGLDGESPIWFVTRYDDGEAILLDDERFVRDPRLALTPDELAAFDVGLPDSMAFIDSNMLNRDGDDHRRLRRLVSKAFTPRMIERLRPRIQEIADGLIDPVAARGEMELVSSFAFPLPITVIAELLGVPPADRDRFREWSDAMVRPALAAAELERFGALMTELVAYLHVLFEERRSEPGEDLVSALVAVEDGGDTLSEEELSSMVALLIVAGHETTVSLIGNATLALLTHPEQLAELRRDPSLLPRAVEELIRYDGPVERTLNRWAAVDVELRGRTIHRGDAVIVILGAADRDPERFDDPDRLDLAAERETRLLAFGRGSHFCLGAPLARLEAEIALGTLLRRLPGLRLALPQEDLRWRPVPLFRSLVALPVAWDA
ncbi:MAG TPA: cytochrome P450 [Gaiellaceae bacterium]|nr:cytochrome P450 [Gaiellaceae bacterium]